MTAIESLLAGLIDFAGLYPPAALDMRSAVRNYLGYREGKHAAALGRLIVDVNRMEELRSVAGDDLRDMKLSVIVPSIYEWNRLATLLNDDVPIEALETKCASAAEIKGLPIRLQPKMQMYIEIPIETTDPEVFAAIASVGAGVKLRMGGVVAEAFPASAAVVRMLGTLAQHLLPFKATAGLHHPIRSRHPFTYARDSAIGTMHGFVNLVCAAALVNFGGDTGEAMAILDEQDPGAWSVDHDAISWRTHHWSANQLAETRKKLVSLGSCSFAEPICDLGALGWL